MRIIILVSVFLLVCNEMQSQNVTIDDLNTTCFVLSELMDKATKTGNEEAIIIYSNAFDKIKKEYSLREAYISYFDSIKITNADIIGKGIVITLNNPPKSPGFTNKEINDFMMLRKDNISLTDFNDFLILKKLGTGKLAPSNLNKLELQNIEKLKQDIKQIKIGQ